MVEIADGVKGVWISQNIYSKFNSYYSKNLNPLHAKVFRGNKNTYLHFMLFFHVDMTQVVEILPQVRQELTYSA